MLAGRLAYAYRFTRRLSDQQVRVYFLMSTWNPYNTMLTRATIDST